MATLLQKTTRFAAQKLRALVPRNQCYRPVGVHASSQRLAQEAGGETRYVELYDATTSQLPVPPELPLRASMYYLPMKAEEPVGPAFVLTLPGGRVNVDTHNTLAIIAADDRLVADVSLQFTAPAQQPQRDHLLVGAAGSNPIFRQRYFRPPLEIAGTVCSLLAGGGAETGNYYHWLLDSLPRLHLVREAGLWDSVDYFLIYNREHRFAVEMLLALGVRNEQILDVQASRHLRARRLVVTSAVRGTGTHAPAWAGAFLKEAFEPLMPGAATPAAFGPLVYVSRRDAAYRHVRNEAAVEALLAEFGFESYSLSELSFREKVALFGGARAVVGPAGAGLTNILFCQPGTALVELSPASFVVPEYFDLTTRLGMSYHSLVSDDGTKTGGRTATNCRHDLTVDLDALRRTVQQALRPAAVAATSSATDELLLPA